VRTSEEVAVFPYLYGQFEVTVVSGWDWPMDAALGDAMARRTKLEGRVGPPLYAVALLRLLKSDRRLVERKSRGESKWD